MLPPEPTQAPLSFGGPNDEKPAIPGDSDGTEPRAVPAICLAPPDRWTEGPGAEAELVRRQHARSGECDVAGVFGFAEGLPRGVIRAGEDLGQVARVREFRKAFHVSGQFPDGWSFTLIGGSLLATSTLVNMAR